MTQGQHTTNDFGLKALNSKCYEWLWFKGDIDDSRLGTQGSKCYEWL